MNLNNVKINLHRYEDDLGELEGILGSLPIEITCENENIEIEAHWSGGKHLHLNCPEGHTYKIKIGKDMLICASSQYSTSLFDIRENLKNVYSRRIHILTGGYKQPSSIFPIFSPL